MSIQYLRWVTDPRISTKTLSYINMTTSTLLSLEFKAFCASIVNVPKCFNPIGHRFETSTNLFNNFRNCKQNLHRICARWSCSISKDFLNGPSPASFCSFSFFLNNLKNNNCSLKRDSNSDRWRHLSFLHLPI